MLRALQRAACVLIGLAGVLGVIVALVAVPGAAHAAVTAPAASARRTDATTPLQVTITTLTPGAILDQGSGADSGGADRTGGTAGGGAGQSGSTDERAGTSSSDSSVTVTGTVTNTDTVAWLDVAIYPFIGTTPMTTAAELSVAAAEPADAEVGERIRNEGDYVKVDRIDPGQSAPYTLEIPRADLGVTAPGVYWFGVHALGSGPDGRDQVADGRARTFLPLISPSSSSASSSGSSSGSPSAPSSASPQMSSVDAAVIVPVRAAINHNSDGSIAQIKHWTQLLGPDGRLARLAELAESSAGHNVSWLIDPAVLATVQQLAAGNPARSIVSTKGSSDGGSSEAPTADPTASSSSSPGPSTDDQDNDQDNSEDDAAVEQGDGGSQRRSTRDDSSAASLQRVAALATSWWSTMSTALTGADVLALPYGDLDLTGAAAHDRSVYTRARKRSNAVFKAWSIAATPVNSPAGGRLAHNAAAMLDASDPASPVLVSDQSLPDDTATTLAQTGDLKLVAMDSAASSGGPGPNDRLSGTAERQRILAEAAVRALTNGPGPLVVTMPTRWSTEDPTQLAAGLSQPWLRLQSLSSVIASSPSTAVSADHLVVPAAEKAQALGQSAFESATDLIRAGLTLQRILTDNDTVATTVQDEALADLSAQRRGVHRWSAAASRITIELLLSKVQVAAPRKATLSGASGTVPTTVTNGLTEPVTVTVRPVTDPGITIKDPAPVEIAAGASVTVLLEAHGAHVGAHNVDLVLTDSSGTRFGVSVSVPVRAAQVSKVIWLFIIVGCGLLFGAITVRLLRRFRAARSGHPGPDQCGSSHPDSEQPGPDHGGTRARTSRSADG